MCYLKTTFIYTLTASVVLTLVTSCGHKINQDTISNLDRYKKAKDILIDNFDNIRQSANFHDYDSLKQVYRSTIMDANRYYFENIISADSNEELKSILKLWDDGLIFNDKVYGTIELTKDSIVIFVTDFDKGTFSGVGQYIIYDPTDNKGGLGKNGNEILEEKKLDNNWTYIIEKKYWNY